MSFRNVSDPVITAPAPQNHYHTRKVSPFTESHSQRMEQTQHYDTLPNQRVHSYNDLNYQQQYHQYNQQSQNRTVSYTYSVSNKAPITGYSSTQERYDRMKMTQRKSSFVFDDEETNVSRFDKINPFKKNTENSSKKDFRKSRKVDDSPVLMYQHSNQSDEVFELMPTLAMGYENSIDKKLVNTNRELRITGDGYYIRGDPLDKTEPVTEVVTQMIVNDGENIPDDTVLEQQSQPLLTHSKEVAKPETNDPIQKPKYKISFKKMFSLKSDKNKKDDESKPVISEQPINVESMADSFKIDPANNYPKIQTQKPEMDIYLHTANQEAPLEETTSSAGLIDNIPVLSALFHRIDRTETLTSQQKVLLKVGIVLWILYEVRSVVF